MSILQSTKKAVEQVTGIARPGRQEVTDLIRRRKANEFWFKDDGLVPNHPFWPLVVYRGAVRLPEEFDPAAVLEELFEANAWEDSWRNGIYDYVHYHSRIHEVLGVAAGTAKVRFGGKKGRTLSLKAGDVAVLPAGTGHQCLSASDDFLVVGAYPPFGTYDECTTAQGA
ncbi:cupin domain-containing protein [Mesorhizobium sp. M1322]|uniref:cupin domain-containing protein n=1 Tax=Mesorhizobium sp. M1322 TaxID=2957081 RepID=UPI00333D2F80